MSKYDETMELIRQKAASKLCEIPFTEDEVGALSIYMEAYLPENLRNDDEWDNLAWLHNIMSAWKKINDADKGIAERNKANKADTTIDIWAGSNPVGTFKPTAPLDKEPCSFF